MEYVVTAELEPPVTAQGLDELQQQGVVALLDRRLALVEGVTGPDQADIDVLDYRISPSADRATVVLVLDAPSLVSAEWAAATVLDELLGEIELLSGWSVADSKVRITEDEFNLSLAAADVRTPDDSSALEAAVEEALESSAVEPALETKHWRETLLECAPRLRALGADAFAADGASESAGRLAAGALIHAVWVVTDEIFYDELSLSINNATVDEAQGLLVLEELPPCYDDRYDSAFARAFLLASAAVATRLSEQVWTPPRCVAEALALRLMMHEAQVLLEAAGLLEWAESTPIFAKFTAAAFTDTSHEELYEVDIRLDENSAEPLLSELETGLRDRGLAFDQWFGKRDGAPGLHPYLQFL
ncbi:hypothetical protein OOZ19_29520 [Saccharopolyspora sp. NFXS83]|uniref:hypothetical protein n=1 Tax=Saccharopolyspora sp. NFXS83 TaxID=2993560 RepID=UPI00224AF5C3|nr:hypothetical protein [Saccharopolyspora sp. NFXS83]MCX2734405.1 hypothetical protein [Saccharopolyspora sp. NFXS83]